MADYHVIETPQALDQYKQASPELLTVLSHVVYPALRVDPTNESGQHPIRYQHGGWYTFEIETLAGACTTCCTKRSRSSAACWSSPWSGSTSRDRE